MTKEAMHKILDLYDRAMEDPEYMTLHAEYARCKGHWWIYWGVCRLKNGKPLRTICTLPLNCFIGFWKWHLVGAIRESPLRILKM